MFEGITLAIRGHHPHAGGVVHAGVLPAHDAWRPHPTVVQ